MRSEEQICQDLKKYIDSKLYNRPRVLASIKKAERTPKIIDLIFSRPDVFKLDSEINHVPLELLTDEILVKYVLGSPESIKLIPEDLISIPVLVAFEFSKRRFERFSAMTWGKFRKKISVPEIYKKYLDDIVELCDKLPFKHYDTEITENYLSYIEIASKEILSLCSNIDSIKETQKANSKYRKVDFGPIGRKIIILVSGYPDSGKTYFSNLLSATISDSICFDSDMLLEKNLLTTSLDRLVSDKASVVVFSDIYAERFFSESELKDAIVFNVLIKPVSVEVMYRNSKYMQSIPYDEYRKYEINKIQFDDNIDFICVENDYTNRIVSQVDMVLDEIIKRLLEMGYSPKKVELKEPENKPYIIEPKNS